MKPRILIIPTGRGGRSAAIFVTGQSTSYVANDDGYLEIGQPHKYRVLTLGQYSGNTNITLNAKVDAHANACVMDDASGLMWSRTVSASVGPTSNGLLPWTTNGSGEGIFTYADAANAALLSGYSDWRIPNRSECISLQILEAPATKVDPTAFPVWFAGSIWSSSTIPNNTTLGVAVLMITTGAPSALVKTSATLPTALVRGPL